MKFLRIGDVIMNVEDISAISHWVHNGIIYLKIRLTGNNSFDFKLSKKYDVVVQQILDYIYSNEISNEKMEI